MLSPPINSIRKITTATSLGQNECCIGGRSCRVCKSLPGFQDEIDLDLMDGIEFLHRLLISLGRQLGSDLLKKKGAGNISICRLWCHWVQILNPCWSIHLSLEVIAFSWDVHNEIVHSFHIWCCFFFFLQMGNASETFLFLSRISKDNDFLMGTLYTIFGKEICLHLCCAVIWTHMQELLYTIFVFPRCAVCAGEWDPAVCGL